MRLLLLLLVLGTSCVVAQEIKSKLRTWTSSIGTKIEAELVSSTGEQVTLKTKAGRTLTVPLNKLSKADQEFIAAKSSPKEPAKGGVPVHPDLKYEIKGDAVTITGCDRKASGALTIPSAIKGKAVISIGQDAFLRCRNLTEIVVPDSVTSIGENAFLECSNLTSIIISNGVTTIEKYAFAKCTSLTSITIPDGVTKIGTDAFLACTSLTEIVVPDSVTSIGANAFLGCSKLTSITISDGVTSMGSMAFATCTSLTSVTIGNSLTNIGDHAFFDCSSLTSITIPDSITSIGSGAFSQCSSLTSIAIPDSVATIGEGAFSGCSALMTIEVAAGNVNYTEVNGVLFNTEMTLLHAYPAAKTGANYVIPDSVTNIGGEAFADCTGLTSITIPNSVTSIGLGAFAVCKSLTSVTFLGDAPKAGEEVFEEVRPTIYRKPEAKGWGDTFAGRPVKLISEKP